jgi:hypothetical protein
MGNSGERELSPRGNGLLTLPSPRGHGSRAQDLTVAAADAEVYHVSPVKVTVKVVSTLIV